MKHRWRLPFIRSHRRASLRRRDDAGDIFRAFVHRLEKMRSLSHAAATTGATLADKT